MWYIFSSASPLSPEMQWGFAGFALILLGIVFWSYKQLFRIINNHLHGIGDKLDKLPCDVHEVKIKQLEEKNS